MKRILTCIAVASLVLSACGNDDDAATGTPTTEPTSEPSPESEAPSVEPTPTEPAPESPSPEPTQAEPDDTVITTGDSEFGDILFDGDNQAIYLFDVERTSTPECYDDCAVAWPPVLTDGEPQAQGAIDAALLGTTERTDGTIQITYNDHPLYYYAHEGPGEVKCHNINLNGGLWYVVQPDGDPAPPG